MITTVAQARTALATRRYSLANVNWAVLARDLAAVTILILLPIVTFWALWAVNPDDRVIFTGDVLVGAFPTRVYVHRLLTSGQIPLWNPYQLGGMPLLADAQVAVYYLPNLLLDSIYWSRDIPYEAFEALIVAHYAIGALLMYGYLRHLRLQPAAALVGAIAFEFNGFFIGHRGHYSMLSVVVWVPGVLWFLGAAWSTANRWRALFWSVGAGLLLSQVFMGGHPQLAFYSSLFLFAYFLFQWLPAGRELQAWWRAPWPAKWQHMLVQAPFQFGVAGVLALGLAMVSLLPMVELLGRSLRNEPTYAFSVQYPLMPRNFISLLIPEFLNWSGTEFRIYAGIFTLVLAVVAWLVPERAHRERWFFTAALAVAVVMSMGGFTSLQGFFYRYVPGFNSVRVTARLFYFANISLAVLAALGLDGLLRPLAAAEKQRLGQLIRGSKGLFALLGVIAAALYLLLAWHVRPVGDEFYFYESLFFQPPADDRYLTLTHQMNGFMLFLVFLGAAMLWLWLRLHERVSLNLLMVSAVLIIAVDITTFAPQHDAAAAPNLDLVGLDGFEIVNLEKWQGQERDLLIEELAALPATARIDNGAAVLPDNYSQIWPAAFATGYNVLDLQTRFEIQTQWPNLSDSLRRDLMSVQLVVTGAENPDPPEEGAQLILGNSQGNVWQRATLPAYAHFSTQIRPSSTSITFNGLLTQAGVAPFVQPALMSDDGSVADQIGDLWPELVARENYRIGETAVFSPVDITVLAGGPGGYSAIVVNGVTVTPEERGLIVAVIDPASGAVLDAAAFDTYLSNRESDRFASLLANVPAGHIVAVATYDEGTAQLTTAARNALASIGAAETLIDKFGQAYALVGLKGAEPGSALERLAPEAQVLDVGIGAATAPPAAFSSQVIRYEQDRITLLVENSATGLLTISETMFPGWQAYVDGVAAPIFLTHGIFRSVVLPPSPTGQPHEVTFIYAPASVRAGMTITVMVLLLALVMALIAWYYGRERQSVDTEAESGAAN
ncbi:MAG: YfhO family protein [Anaerolineales bacterium]|nr:YfhO family protein [Anaerolineales bacterium]